MIALILIVDLVTSTISQSGNEFDYTVLFILKESDILENKSDAAPKMIVKIALKLNLTC